jgi:DNA-binding HxlR family transcriptional regulator
MAKTTTKTAKRVRGSSTGRPIMVALDLLGRRWSLRILWELRGGPLSFRALQAACGQLSPSVLQQRLNDLREARLVGHDGESGYTLTDQAMKLQPLLLALDRWAADWAAEAS